MREEEKTMADTENTAAPKKEGRPVISRRALCVGLGGTAALLGLGAVRYAGSAPLVRPPGGQDEEALVSACIRCEKCYAVSYTHLAEELVISQNTVRTHIKRIYRACGAHARQELIELCETAETEENSLSQD